MNPNQSKEHEPSVQDVSQPKSVNLTAMAYWRRSLWNYRKNMPVVFVISGNMLSIIGLAGEIVSCDVSSVTAHMAQTATLKLTIGGVTYCIRGDTSIISPKPSSEQLDILGQRVINNSLKYAEAGAASAVVGVAGQILNNSALSGIGSGATVGAEAASIISAEIAVGNLAKLLVNAGVVITGSKPHVALYAIGSGIIVYPIAIVGIEISKGQYSSSITTGIFFAIIFVLPVIILYKRGRYNRHKTTPRI